MLDVLYTIVTLYNYRTNRAAAVADSGITILAQVPTDIAL